MIQHRNRFESSTLNLTERALPAKIIWFRQASFPFGAKQAVNAQKNTS
jgi:hypothetical protein